MVPTWLLRNGLTLTVHDWLWRRFKCPSRPLTVKVRASRKSPVVNSHPFVAAGGLKDAPRAPVWKHVTLFNTAGHLPVAHGGTPVPLRAPCGRPQAISHT
jgi:hypothetical protein